MYPETEVVVYPHILLFSEFCLDSGLMCGRLIWYKTETCVFLFMIFSGQLCIDSVLTPKNRLMYRKRGKYMWVDSRLKFGRLMCSKRSKHDVLEHVFNITPSFCHPTPAHPKEGTSPRRYSSRFAAPLRGLPSQPTPWQVLAEPAHGERRGLCHANSPPKTHRNLTHRR